jgi:hypothetical protein
MDVPAGRTHNCVALPIHQPASATQPLTCTHACVQCVRSACVAPSLRNQASSSLRPQGSGGVTRTLNLPFSSPLFAFASNPNDTHRDLTPCLPASQRPVRPPGAAPVPIISPHAGSAAPQIDTTRTHAPTHHTHTVLYCTYFTLYSTCRFRKIVASSLVYGRFGLGLQE